jgi:hypothetical protein
MSNSRRQRGQSLVEFALVVPLFLLVMLALIDFSRLLFTYVSMTNGAREMVRVLATSWNPGSAVAAFNNYTVVAGTEDPTTDSVTVRVGDQFCGNTINSPCPPPPPASAVCTLPLSSCTLSTLTPPSHRGFVEVQVTYTFHFNPLFQNRLAGIVDVSFLRPATQVTTTARAYVE